MKSPYQLLGVAEAASDAEIKQAYLQNVRDCPPDRDQERFQQIQTAYQTIKNAKSRLAYAVFSLPPADFNSLLGSAFHSEDAPKALSASDFMGLLNASADEKDLVNAVLTKP